MHHLRPAIVLLLVLTLLTGVVYPLAVTGIANFAFPFRSGGSLLKDGDRVVGSERIGQSFDAKNLFWSRPSAGAYGATPSSGSNAGPLQGAMLDRVAARVKALRAADPGNDAQVPVDLVTASGSGIDPDISVAAARYQAARVARENGIELGEVGAMIDRHTQGRTFGLLGEPGVNVLQLNLDVIAAVKSAKEMK